ncbi:unnamed protein product [Polarella glacialis]|uniref:Secreted protein n=1 Tax=Polarella glacialis TaxID=89957 RepID=A0A813L9J3_POLGL|nr:unnamed protein product [Polarella glacialis]
MSRCLMSQMVLLIKSQARATQTPSNIALQKSYSNKRDTYPEAPGRAKHVTVITHQTSQPTALAPNNSTHGNGKAVAAAPCADSTGACHSMASIVRAACFARAQAEMSRCLMSHTALFIMPCPCHANPFKHRTP